MRQFTLGSRYYYMRLAELEKKVYKKIYDCWATGESVAKLELPGAGFTLPSGMALHQVVTYIIEENPHLFHLETSQFQYRRQGSHVTITADNVYTREEYQRVYAALISRVDYIVEKAKRFSSEYERLRFLHDYLAENITYDRGNPDPKSQREIHTIVGSLLNSACVCDGYARAYRLLCDQLNLSCIVALGDAVTETGREPHAWNFVKLNHQVYHVDVTWDSNLIAGDCPVTDYYFMRNDAIFAKKHSWDHALYPPIYKDDPHRMHPISSKWELEKYICEQIKDGRKNILIPLADSFPGNDALKQLLEEIIARNSGAFHGFKGYQSVYYSGIQYAGVCFEQERGETEWPITNQVKKLRLPGKLFR